MFAQSLFLGEPKIAYAEVPTVLALPFSTSTLPNVINFYAMVYDVDADVMAKVVDCESRGDPLAVGDHGHSRGLVQIYDKYHPDISKEEAFNPYFSLNYLAENLAKGKGNMWTCYRAISAG